MSIGEKIRLLRKNQGLSQAALAEKLFVTSQAVGQWESGKTVPDADRLPEIAAALHTTVAALLSEHDGDGDFTVKDSLFSAEHMFSRLISYTETEGLRQTFFALQYMRKSHAGQYRKPSLFSDAKVPYITHPLLIACHGHALRIREDSVLSAALLHDVCEDCGVDPEELPVSEEIKTAVDLLTYRKDPKESGGITKKKYYEAIAGNRIATIVKILDRCNNISTMAASFSETKLRSYIKETEKYVLPLIEDARHSFPEYSDALFLVKYHMNSVLESLKSMMLRSM